MVEPVETRMVRLGDVASFIRGVTFKPTDVEEPSESNVDCMRTKNVQAELDRRDVWSVPKSILKRPNQLLKAGDLLVSSANSWNLVGKACWIPELERPTTFGGFVSVLRPEKADARYLFRWFTSDKVQTTMRSFGNQTTNISNLDLKRASNLLVPLPPLDEQRQIAAILDKADELRTKRRQALAHLDTLTQSIFHSMFGDPIRNDRNWKTVRLDQLGRITTGNTPSRAVDSNFGDFIEWIKTDNINIPGATLGLASEGLSETGATKGRIVESGSVLMTCIAGSPKVIGNVSIADRRVAFNQQINAFTPNEGPAYYWYGLLSGIKQSVQAASTGGMTGMVSKSALAAIAAIETPLELQQTFATRIAAVERLKENHCKHLAELDALFASLQHRAFSGRI